MITLIWAESNNGIIGIDNKIPWNFKKDMKFFRDSTIGKSVVMGYNTYLSIGENGLKGRNNYVLTRSREINKESISTLRSIDDVITLSQTEDLFIIGGKQVYELLMPYADRLLVTVIRKDFEGDTAMKPINRDVWRTVNCFKDIEDQTELTFFTYERK